MSHRITIDAKDAFAIWHGHRPPIVADLRARFPSAEWTDVTEPVYDPKSPTGMERAAWMEKFRRAVDA